MPINSLYSCFSITAESEQDHWELFENGVGWPIAGDPKLITTRAHTNIPRSGGTGLPMGWEAWIRTWRATLNTRFVDGPVLDWAAETAVKLTFNERTYSEAPLLDLLSAPQAVFEDSVDFYSTRYDSNTEDKGGFRPMWIHENIRYAVELSSPQPAVEGLRAWLREHTVNGRLLCWVHLDGLVMSRHRNINA